MDNKTWLWKKKSTTERSIIATEKTDIPSKGNEEEVQMLLTDKSELQKNLKDLNDKLSTALSECNAKEDLIKKHEKIAQEAIAGCKKTEAELASVRQEFNRTLQQKVDCEERVAHLDAALKECMQQLRFVREEQEKRIQDAVIKMSREFEESQVDFEEKLAEAGKRLAKVGVENTHLNKALLAKDALVEDLNRQKAQAEVDINALMSRLECMEKENGSLKYDVHVLEKELEIRNEEREFNRRAAEASHKQHLENVKKIAKLESECQRLRLLVRKRLPGPAAFAKMKNEVEVLGRDSVDMRKKKSNSNPPVLLHDFSVDNSPDIPGKKINILNQQLRILEEENKSLKEALNKKTSELQLSRIMYAQTASKLSQVESQLEESSRGRSGMDPARSNLMTYEVSQASMSDIGSDDKISCAESWASALIAELDHFKNGKQRGSPSCKSIGASDINLMDDFLEMEKLAIVSADKPSEACQASLDGGSTIIGPLESKGGEIVPVSGSMLGLNTLNQENVPKESSGSELPRWLRDIVEAIMEQNRITQRSPKEVLEDVRLALDNTGNLNSRKLEHTNQSSNDPAEAGIPCINGHTFEKPMDISSVKPSSNEVTDIDISLMKKTDLSKYINKVIELIEGMSLPSSGYDNSATSSKDNCSLFPYKNSQTPTGYMVRVFQWKTSELSAVLEQFVHTCYDLVNGKADLKKFTQELSSALDWILNHCFSLQDVSSMKDAIKKHFDLDETRSDSEAEVGNFSPFLEADRFCVSLPMSTTSNRCSNFSQLEEFSSNMKIENQKLKDELMSAESAKRDLEARLQSTISEIESLKTELKESENSLSRLQKELENSQGTSGMVQGQMESLKLMNEDLHRQLAAASAELNEVQEKLQTLQVELENKTNCCEELESKCLELQLQLESMIGKGTQNDDGAQEDKQLRSDWEIAAASEKLAECQETILNLGKQLKALAPSGEADLFDKLISAPTDPTQTTSTTIMVPAPSLSKKKHMNQRSSLLDQMLAEDDAIGKELNLPDTKEIDHLSSVNGIDNNKESLEKVVDGVKQHNGDATTQSLAIVPSKKKTGGSFWKKLLWRKKSHKKMQLPIPSQQVIRESKST